MVSDCLCELLVGPEQNGVVAESGFAGAVLILVVELLGELLR